MGVADPPPVDGWWQTLSIGADFALLVGRWATAVLPDAVIGVVWWVLGCLLTMPAWPGMNAMIFNLNTTAWRSLGGHLVYGLLLGVGYALVGPRLRRG